MAGATGSSDIFLIRHGILMDSGAGIMCLVAIGTAHAILAMNTRIKSVSFLLVATGAIGLVGFTI